MRCDKCLKDICYEDAVSYPKYFITYAENMNNNERIPVYLCRDCHERFRAWLKDDMKPERDRTLR